MIIWFIFAVITAVVLVVLLTPFYRAQSGARSREAFDREVYRDQLAEVEADQERGLLGPEEAEAARIEISRRLIAAKDSQNSGAGDRGADLVRNSAFWMSALLVPALGLGTYLALGHADMAGVPHAGRFEKPLEQQRVDVLIARVEERLRMQPGDGRGWEVIAPVYMRQGRYDDAANAFERAIRLLGEKESLLTGFAEALIASNQGIVPDAAREAFEKILAKNPGDLRARFRLALADEQDGKFEKAADTYRELILLGDPESPWRKIVSERLAYVNEQVMTTRRGGAPRVARRDEGPRGPTADDVQAAQGMSAGQRAEMINNMVGRLASRLEENGKDLEGWLRLMNAYVVLGRAKDAKAALKKAEGNFAGDKSSLAQLDAMARKLGLKT